MSAMFHACLFVTLNSTTAAKAAVGTRAFTPKTTTIQG
jgi:hypothetical protein